MKIGYNEATAMIKSNLANDLILAEKHGYDYIEIRLDMLRNYLKENTIEELADFFSKNKLKPYALNAIEEMNFRVGQSFEDMCEEVKNACQLAQKINNPYLIVVPSFRNDLVWSKSQKEIEENSVEVLNKLADISERNNVKIAFEPVGFPSCMVKSMQFAWNIVQKVNRDSVGLVIDAFNVYIYDSLCDIDILEDIDINKVFVFHINDCEGGIPLYKIELNHRVWPGEGIIPLDKMLGIFCKKGFDKITSIELFRNEYWELEPDFVFKTGIEKIKNQLKLYYHN